MAKAKLATVREEPAMTTEQSVTKIEEESTAREKRLKAKREQWAAEKEQFIARRERWAAEAEAQRSMTTQKEWTTTKTGHAPSDMDCPMTDAPWDFCAPSSNAKPPFSSRGYIRSGGTPRRNRGNRISTKELANRLLASLLLKISQNPFLAAQDRPLVVENELRAIFQVPESQLPRLSHLLASVLGPVNNSVTVTSTPFSNHTQWGHEILLHLT